MFRACAHAYIYTIVIALASARAYIARWPPGWLHVAYILDDLYYMLHAQSPRYIYLCEVTEIFGQGHGVFRQQSRGHVAISLVTNCDPGDYSSNGCDHPLIDLRWRIVWAHLAHHSTPSQLADRFCVSERTVMRYIQLFQQTGDIEPGVGARGPRRLLGDYEEVVILQTILARPGIYLAELQDELFDHFGVLVSVPTICRTLKPMGCTSIMLQSRDRM